MSHRHAIPRIETLLNSGKADIVKLLTASRAEANRTDRYRSWEELRKHLPPKGLTLEEWWVGLKLNRAQGRHELPVENSAGVPFSFVCDMLVQKALHEIDKQAGGTLYSDARNPLSPRHGDYYLVSSLMEESIMSSMLEGASVTRAAAKSILRERREPMDPHERMVLNNYRTMQQIKAWKDEPITPEKILALHLIMTEGTLSPGKAGRYRRAEDDVRVENSLTGEVVHIPPSAASLPARMESLCRFAEEEDTGVFIHPVLKAIILHFWLAYDHPFVDGNGRTARVLFYWVMLKHGFWLFEYVTISQAILNRSAKSYYTAFLDAEEDDADLNYFIADQLFTIQKAIADLHAYVKRKENEQKKLLAGLHDSHRFNYRQKMLLARLLKQPDMAVTVESHKREHNVVTQTARTDLTALVDAGLMTCRKQGKGFLYAAVPALGEKLAQLETE